MTFPVVKKLEQLALYMRPSCPYCLKVQSFCDNQNLVVALKNIAEGEHLEALMTGGGKRQVPCLKITTDDGVEFWMYESLDIINYLQHFK